MDSETLFQAVGAENPVLGTWKLEGRALPPTGSVSSVLP